MKKLFIIVFLAVFFAVIWNVARYIYTVSTVDPLFGEFRYGVSVLDVLLPAVLGAGVGSLTTLRLR